MLRAVMNLTEAAQATRIKLRSEESLSDRTRPPSATVALARTGKPGPGDDLAASEPVASEALARIAGSSSLCVVHFAVSEVWVIGGHASDIDLSAWPTGQDSGYALTVDGGWVVSASGSKIGIAQTVNVEAEVGLAGPTTDSGISQSTASGDSELPAEPLAVCKWGMHATNVRRPAADDRYSQVRRTRRIAVIVDLLGHSSGSRHGERLMQRLGMLSVLERHFEARLSAVATGKAGGHFQISDTTGMTTS